MRISKTKIRAFQTKILTWWEKNKRTLPWRLTHDPYKIFVSEVMLQQTQVSRVYPVYLKFIAKFPTVTSLAHASTAEVLRDWKGMGYNSRALYLKNASVVIAKNFGGKFPESEKELLMLPGIGKYTARAILVFAYQKHEAMIDTNIRQIITHFFFDGVSQKEEVIEDIAMQLVPRGKSWEWHQALMDYGALALSTDKKIQGKLKPMRKKPSKPFHETDRFFRGRVMDALREKTYEEGELLTYMVEFYGKEKEFFIRIFTGLEKDGLVRRKMGTIRLP